jgi:hypothetical protein
LAWIDESGLLMAPLVRRTWAMRGQRPVWAQKTRHREKVSVAAALWLSPRRDHLGLFFHTLVNAYFNNAQVARYLEAMLETLPGRVVVVWDGGGMHQGDPINRLLEQTRNRLTVELLPPYAPTLMPVEQVWTWLKYGRLCNYAPDNAHDLNNRVLAELTAIQHNQDQLRNFFHASELPLPRTLLS